MSSSFFAALYSAFGRYDVVHIHAEGPAFFCWMEQIQRLRTEKDQILLPVKKDTDHLQTVMSTVEEAGH